MKKEKEPGRLRFADYFGTTAMGATEAISAALLSSWFMLYLTDYAGIGKWGTILGSSLLLVTRLLGLVTSPVGGLIIDRAKITRIGKYKPFIMLSTAMTTIGLCFLFFLPEAFSDNPVMICVWILFFYILCDIGSAFYTPSLVYRTLASDQTERGKLLVGPRYASVLIGMTVGGLIPMVNKVNESIGNMHTSFGITVAIYVVALAAVSLLGICFVKEKYHSKETGTEKVKITDIFAVLKNNSAMRTSVFAQVFSGFMSTFLFATMTYYLKWAYCADLSDGSINSEKYGTLSMLGSLMMILPLILGTAIAAPLMKAFKSAIKLRRFLLLTEGIVGALLFVLHITGTLQTSPFLFFALVSVTSTCMGVDYVPHETINLECIDYEVYLSGKDRAALCYACNKVVAKVQNAISSGLVGFLLVAIGYNVDSATDTYLGELSALPSLLTWFIVIMGLVPCALGIISYLILKRYPITDEIRKAMSIKLSK